jgi:hypothetical protein
MVTLLPSLWFVGEMLGQSPLDNSREFVSAKDLQKGTVRIVGVLGVEYGKTMSVIGRWELPREVAKATGLDLIITHVNGRKLEPPVIFNQRSVNTSSTRKEEARTPRDGSTWEGRCWEGGRYWEPANVVRDELGLPPVSPAHGGFETELHFYRFTDNFLGKPK